MSVRKIFGRTNTRLLCDFNPAQVENWNDIQQETDKHFKNVFIRVTVEVVPKTDPNIRMVGYWYAEIVKKIRFALIYRGNYMNMPQTEEWIRDHLKEITKEEISFLVLRKFISNVIVDRKNGMIKEVVPMLEELSDAEFSGLFDPIICWAAQELEISINYPNEWEE